jgi:hypothetical protein
MKKDGEDASKRKERKSSYSKKQDKEGSKRKERRKSTKEAEEEESEQKELKVRSKEEGSRPKDRKPLKKQDDTEGSKHKDRKETIATSDENMQKSQKGGQSHSAGQNNTNPRDDVRLSDGAHTSSPDAVAMNGPLRFSTRKDSVKEREVLDSDCSETPQKAATDSPGQTSRETREVDFDPTETP